MNRLPGGYSKSVPDKSTWTRTEWFPTSRGKHYKIKKSVKPLDRIFSLSLLFSFMSQIKEFLSSRFIDVSRIFFEKITVENNLLVNSMILHLNKNFKRIEVRERHFIGILRYIKSIEKERLVAYDFIGDDVPIIFYNKFRPLVFTKFNDRVATISFLRGTYTARKIIEEATKQETLNELENISQTNKNQRRFKIIEKRGNASNKMIVIKNNDDGDDDWDDEDCYRRSTVDALNKVRVAVSCARPIGVDENDIGYPDENKPFESLFYNEAVGSVVNEVQTWLKNESWFRRKSIPWKRGYLLHGTPGTGKTAFVRALAQELDMPIISFDLSTMMNDDLAVAWRDCDLHKPCIALFEDIDSTFDGRENVSSCGDDGLSFGYFLNTLDGVSKSDGVIIIITTNDIEKVDPALGSIETETMTSRPCRIDRIIKFDVLTKDAREKMAERILGEFDKKVWKDIFKGSEKDTGSQFQERCCRRALQLFWEKSQETEGCE